MQLEWCNTSSTARSAASVQRGASLRHSQARPRLFPSERPRTDQGRAGVSPERHGLQPEISRSKGSLLRTGISFCGEDCQRRRKQPETYGKARKTADFTLKKTRKTEFKNLRALCSGLRQDFLLYSLLHRYDSDVFSLAFQLQAPLPDAQYKRGLSGRTSPSSTFATERLSSQLAQRSKELVQCGKPCVHPRSAGIGHELVIGLGLHLGQIDHPHLLHIHQLGFGFGLLHLG